MSDLPRKSLQTVSQIISMFVVIESSTGHMQIANSLTCFKNFEL